MRVFVAGATGAIGRVLVPQLIESRHEVVALIRARAKAEAVQAAGAKVVLADALDRGALTAAVRHAEPEAIVHQLTALAGVGDFELTNRLRTEVTDTLLGAARLVGAGFREGLQ